MSALPFQPVRCCVRVNPLDGTLIDDGWCNTLPALYTPETAGGAFDGTYHPAVLIPSELYEAVERFVAAERPIIRAGNSGPIDQAVIFSAAICDELRESHEALLTLWPEVTP